MLLLVTIITGDLTQVLVLLLWWSVVFLVVSSKRIGCTNPGSWHEAWKSWPATAIITTAPFIIFILLMVFLRLVWGFSILKTWKKLWSRLLRLREVPVKDLFLSAFIRFGERSMAPKTVSIYFLDPEPKVEGGFSFYNNSFFNGFFLSVFSMIILTSLGTDRKL